MSDKTIKTKRNPKDFATIRIHKKAMEIIQTYAFKNKIFDYQAVDVLLDKAQEKR